MRLCLLGTLAALAALFLPAAAVAATSCDPMAKQNDAAYGDIKQGKYEKADGVLHAVLKANPGDFRARYYAGVLLVARNSSYSDYLLGIETMIDATKYLPKGAAGEACASAGDFYKIYNTIGADYFNDSNLERAAHFYQIAFGLKAKLQASTLADLYGNLGLLAYYQGNFTCAAAGYQDAVSYGNRTYLKKFKDMDAILAAAGAERVCGPADYFLPLFADIKLGSDNWVHVPHAPLHGVWRLAACTVAATQVGDKVSLGYPKGSSEDYHIAVNVGRVRPNVCVRFSYNFDRAAMYARVAQVADGDSARVQIFLVGR